MKVLSMSDDENLKRAKSYHYSKIKKNLKTNKKEEIINISSQKNIHTAPRTTNIVDCNIVNLNLIDVPNINDDNNNSNSSSEMDLLYKPPLKNRKINSVDSKRPFIVTNKIQNENILFYSSNIAYKLRK